MVIPTRYTAWRVNNSFTPSSSPGSTSIALQATFDESLYEGTETLIFVAGRGLRDLTNSAGGWPLLASGGVEGEWFQWRVYGPVPFSSRTLGSVSWSASNAGGVSTGYAWATMTFKGMSGGTWFVRTNASGGTSPAVLTPPSDSAPFMFQVLPCAGNAASAWSPTVDLEDSYLGAFITTRKELITGVHYWPNLDFFTQPFLDGSWSDGSFLHWQELHVGYA